MPRWSCPSGKHPDAIGPERARRLNTCRWCLPCSEKEGVLVERVCVSAVKRREKRAEAEEKREEARAKRRREVERVEAASYPGRLAALASKWTTLKTWNLKRPRRLVVQVRSSRMKSYATGGWTRDAVNGNTVLTITAGSSEPDAMATLLWYMSSISCRGSTAQVSQLWRIAAEEICGHRIEVTGKNMHAPIAAALAETLTPAQLREAELRGAVVQGVAGAKQVLEDYMLEQTQVPG